MAGPEPISVLIVDDHPVVRDGIRAILSSETDIAIAGEAGTAEDGIRAWRALRPAIILFDLLLPDRAGDDAIAEICGQTSNSQVIVLTTVSGDEQIYRALDAGARGYLFKDAARTELAKAIRAVVTGKRYFPPTVGACLVDNLPRSGLSSREIEVLKLIAGGFRNKEIAFDLSIAEATVNAHVKHILEKLNASDRTQAVMTGLRRGLIRL
jgi:DNA-binding NarL/FixJ family response regulator